LLGRKTKENYLEMAKEHASEGNILRRQGQRK
jgi:hypothetical protein